MDNSQNRRCTTGHLLMYDTETDWTWCQVCGNDGKSVSQPELEQRKPLSRKGGNADVELGRNISCDRADRRPVGP
jgi:hypothetical protein